MWNVSARVAEDLPQSNNHVEGWHHRFAFTLAYHSPTVWKAVDAIRAEQALTVCPLTQLQEGDHPQGKKRKYARIDRRLQRLLDTLEDHEALDFLSGPQRQNVYLSKAASSV